MPSFNSVHLMGNLTRDPSLKHLPSGTSCAEFGIAMNSRYKTKDGEEKEDVTFVDCTAFGRTAEVINEHMKKGKPIFIDGRLKFDSWEDKEGGGKRSKLSVIVENFQFVGDKRDDEQPAKPPAQRPQTKRAVPLDDHIPF